MRASLNDVAGATVFPGPMGVGASFNRTAWSTKGEVISTEMRAFNNHYGKRGLGHYTGIAGFGPNINIARDPRFGTQLNTKHTNTPNKPMLEYDT